VLFRSVNLLLSNYFLATNRPAVVTIQAGVSLGICVLGNILLIPSLGAVGAAVAIVSAEAAGGVFLFVRQMVSEGGVRFRHYALVVLQTTAALVPAVVVSYLIVR
jgi:O-antigen/teichoic acid export membrane protein